MKRTTRRNHKSYPGLWDVCGGGGGGHLLFIFEVNVKYLAIVLTTGHRGIIINISQHFEFKMSQA